MTNKKYKGAIEGILWLSIIVPLLYLFSVYGSLPQTVPLHYDINGVADRFGDKSSLLYLVPGLILFIYLLLKYIPRIDPKNNIANNSNYGKIRVIMQLFIGAVGILVVVSAKGGELNSTKLATYLLAFLILGLGNYLSSVKPNYFVGLRTPWTLENEQVWRKTHRLLGRSWFVGGILLFPIIYLTSSAVGLSTALIWTIGSGLFFVYYSYVLYKQEGSVSGE